MEHPFLSRRSILDTSKNITDLAKDVLIILSSTADEHTAIKERREPEIKNETSKKPSLDELDVSVCSSKT